MKTRQFIVLCLIIVLGFIILYVQNDRLERYYYWLKTDQEIIYTRVKIIDEEVNYVKWDVMNILDNLKKEL